MPPRLAFGITAGARPEAQLIGSSIEALGYEELWANDTRGADGLATLAQLARGAPRPRLAVGVIALSEQTPAQIANRVRATGLGPERLSVGVGSGSGRSLAVVEDGVAGLRDLIPGYDIAMAAVGPRMAHLGGRVADAVVANWALPARLAELRDLVRGGADAAGRPAPRLVAYVRTAVGQDAAARLRAEMERYARMGPHYARAFADQPDELVGIAVESDDPDEVRDALEPYSAVVDTVVVRGLPATDSVAEWLEVARAAAP